MNNIVESDHGKLKRIYKPTLGFKSMKTAKATLEGFEIMRALKKGQAKSFQTQAGLGGEIKLIERCFNLDKYPLPKVRGVVVHDPVCQEN